MKTAAFKIEGMHCDGCAQAKDGGWTRARCDGTVFVADFANNRIEKWRARS
jgi:hypothetical protein